MLKYALFAIFLSLFPLILSSSCKTIEPNNEYPKLIITTDIGGDPDDTQSLIRLLIYSNELEIAGIIVSASGTRGELGVDTIQPQLVKQIISAYGEVAKNLQKHDPNYPSEEYLHSIVKCGNPHRGLNYIGEGNDTEGSEWIITQVDNSESTVNISIWGGQTDVIQALYKVKKIRSHDEYMQFISKIRIYDINDQDGIFPFIREQFPELFYILAKAPEGTDKREGAYRGMYLGGDETTTSLGWLDDNVRIGHGPMGELYPPKTWTAPNPYGALKEGDTPSWFYFLNNGLQNPDHPDWGGWGGRFLRDFNQYYTDAEDFAGAEIHARASVYRWRNSFQADFASRMDRCLMSPTEVNHAPFVVVNGDRSRDILFIDVKPGETITLQANGTQDIDNDILSYHWWIYPEAGSVQECPEMWPIDQPVVTLTIPEGIPGSEMHLICEVSDDGNPALTGYRRIVIRIN